MPQAEGGRGADSLPSLHLVRQDRTPPRSTSAIWTTPDAPPQPLPPPRLPLVNRSVAERS